MQGVMWLAVIFVNGSVAFVLELLCFENSAHFKAKFARSHNLLSVNREVVADFPFVAEADVCGQCSVR